MSKKARRIRLAPLNLPEIRAGLASWVRTEIAESGEWGTWFERMRQQVWSSADSLASAPAWWVSSEMTSVAVAASAGIPDSVLPATTTGFIVFESSLPERLTPGLEYRVRAMSWTVEGPRSTDTEETCHIGCQYFTSDKEALAREGEKRLPLVMIKIHVPSMLPIRAAEVLRAVWALSSQPSVCEVQELSPSFAPGAAPPDPMARKVKMLVLREVKHSAAKGGGDGEGREYSHRFVVRGFWRNQPCGPRNSERRLQWIPPFIKGPADKPLVVRETVRVWKR